MLPTIATGNVGSALAGGYEVANSCRFNSGSSDYLNKTLGTPTNNKIYTWSGWFKKTKNDEVAPNIFGSHSGGLRDCIRFDGGGNALQMIFNEAGSGNLVTTQLLRDSTAWYHLVVAVDTTQSTATNRVKMYLNGNQITSFSTSTYPAQNYVNILNSAVPHVFGKNANLSNEYFNGYIAETVFIDGEQLDPLSFGEFDDSGIWKPIDVSGLTFGNNGFYLEFKQSGTSANSSGLGADTSGNDHHFTVNNLTAVDQSLDTCTNNFAVLNNLVPNSATYSEGNLKITTSSNWESSGQSIPVTQGKWYGEFIASSNSAIIGVDDFDFVNTWSVLYFGSSANGVGYWNGYSGQLYKNNSYSSYSGGAYGSTDIIGVYLDMDNKFVYFSVNGVMQNSGDPSSGSSGTGGEALSGTTYVMGGGNYTGTLEANFGSPSFAITSGNADANGYGNFEYNPTYSGVNYYSLNTKNYAEFG